MRDDHDAFYGKIWNVTGKGKASEKSGAFLIKEIV